MGWKGASVDVCSVFNIVLFSLFVGHSVLRLVVECIVSVH